MKFHVCQSVDGALKNCSKRDWRNIGRENKMSGPEAKRYMELQQKMGRKVLPIGDECEGFSYITGCPGHEEERQCASL